MSIFIANGPIPKPGKSKRRPRLDGRDVCETAAEWEQRRKECHARAAGRCECGCRRIVPLHDLVDEDYGEVVTFAGHAHHKNGTRGLGGGKRDDSLSNLIWLSAYCHKLAHKSQKVVPSKHG